MAPSCNGRDTTVLPNNVGSGRSGTIAPTTCPHFQQRRRERPGTAACQDCHPSHEPRCPCTGLLVHRFRPSSGLGELSQEGLCLIRPSSAHLASEHHESGFPKLPCELGIGPLLLSPCGCQICPVFPHATGCGRPSRLRSDTNVVSTANCAPWNNGKPSAAHPDGPGATDPRRGP